MKRLLPLLAAATALSAADLYRVAGVIVDSETGSPIANASVALSTGGQAGSDMPTTTGADGRFAFDAPRGTLRLSAAVAGSSQVYGEMSPFADMGCAVITGPDQDTAHLVFRWHRPAVIAGRVMDDQGEPVENARVQLFYSGVVDGHARVAPLNEASTNDRGDYRIWDIPAAAYYVAVLAQPWYGNTGLARSSQAQPRPSYAAVYYPDTADVTRAVPLKVQPGEEAHADFTLAPVAAATVTVNCDGGVASAEASFPQRGGTMTASVTAQGIGGAETAAPQQAFGRCPLAVGGVLPGHYLVRLSDMEEAASPSAGQRWIDVGAGDITVSISLHPAAAVSGKVTLKNGAARPGGILIRLYRELDNRSEEAAIGVDGGFSFPRVEPGKYIVMVSGAGYHAETVRAGDTALPGAVLNIEDGVEARLSVVVSDEDGRLKGYATRDDQPVANMLVVLVPRDPASAHRNLGYQTDSDGSFDWPPLPAGDYLLFAVDDPTIAYADPEAVKPYLAQAKSIRIEPGKILEERVPVRALVKE
ncbi:MAG TPA: carboxypeptidase-like regulatory domain-containing protein [Bryobacteraceae bacterium]